MLISLDIGWERSGVGQVVILAVLRLQEPEPELFGPGGESLLKPPVFVWGPPELRRSRRSLADLKDDISSVWLDRDDDAVVL